MQHSDGSSALMTASRYGHTEVVRQLCRFGAQVELQNGNGESALRAACQNGHTKVVKLLLEHGAQVDPQYK